MSVGFRGRIFVASLVLALAWNVEAQTEATPRSGFPVLLSTAGPVRFSTPVAADLDKNGTKWIIVGTAGVGTGGWLYVIKRDGTIRPGWPKQLPAEIASSPAVGDVNGDGNPDIVIGYGSNTDLSLPGGLIAFDRSGNQIWKFSPLDTDKNGQPDHVWSTPALYDFNGDGALDVVFGSWDFNVYVLDGKTGLPLPGWPVFARDSVWSSPAIADLDGDGVPEIIIGADSHPEGPPVNWKAGGTLFVFRANGTNFPGFPQFITPPPGQAAVGIVSSPAIGDIDGDGCPEIIVGTGNSLSPAEKALYAFHSNGSTVAGWPVLLNDHVEASPALADLNGDGTLDVVAVDLSGYLYAINGKTTPPSFIFPPFRPKTYTGATAVTASGPIVAQVGANNPAILIGNVGWDVTIVSKTGTAISDDGTHGGKLTYTTGNSVVSPIVADLDGTGQLTLIAASQPKFGAGGLNAGVFAWNIGTPGQNATPWPMLHRDERRNGWGAASTPPACAPTPPTSRFYPLPPCRVSDSRNNAYLTYGGPALAYNEERVITLPGVCGVPLGAKAVAVNVTVTGAAAAGLLRLYPSFNGVPTGSTISYGAAQTRANNATVALSFEGSGNLTVRVEQPFGFVHVILDVSGYYQ
jgi:hypothetical protein